MEIYDRNLHLLEYGRMRFWGKKSSRHEKTGAQHLCQHHCAIGIIRLQLNIHQTELKVRQTSHYLT